MNNSNFIKLRWCSLAFYQIELPDGTSIITDPVQYQYPENMVAEQDYIQFRDRNAAEILDRVDYIILSHTHFDHVQDLTEVMNKFPDARVIVPDTLALALLLEKNFATVRRNIFIASHQDKLCFPEFTLECYAGKHTVFSSSDPFLGKIKEKNFREDFRDANGITDFISAMYAASGGMDLRNYVITTPGGMKTFIWAGQILEDFRRFLYHDMKPDIMFVQIAATNIGGDRENPSGTIIGDFALDVQPQIVMPIHQEKYTKVCLENIQNQCNKYFEEKGSSIRYENPTAYKWFTVYKDENGKVSVEGC